MGEVWLQLVGVVTSPMQMCRVGCSSPNCGSNECAYRDGTCCNYYCKSLYPECSCLLGYRNGAQSSDNDLCMGPSERGRRPCYPRPCNPDWTACVSEVRTTTTTTTPTPQPSPSPQADVECDRWVNKTRWINQTRWINETRWIDRVRWEDKINWTQKVNWTDKINWINKTRWINQTRWINKTIYKYVNFSDYFYDGSILENICNEYRYSYYSGSVNEAWTTKSWKLGCSQYKLGYKTLNQCKSQCSCSKSPLSFSSHPQYKVCSKIQASTNYISCRHNSCSGGNCCSRSANICKNACTAFYYTKFSGKIITYKDVDKYIYKIKNETRWINKTRWVERDRWINKTRWVERDRWINKTRWVERDRWINKTRWVERDRWINKTRWVDKVNWTQKVNWTDKINWIDRVRWINKTNYSNINVTRVNNINVTRVNNINVTRVNNINVTRVNNVTIVIFEYQNKSFGCLNETIIYLNNSYLNSSLFSNFNYNYSRDFDFANYNPNITTNISLQIKEDTSADVSVNKNKSDCSNSDDLSLREILIILGFSIVVLCFIIYNVIDFFELKFCDDCCKKKQNKEHPMDRNFADMFEMAAFDDDGNFMFGKKNVAVQTENTRGIDSHERKSVDV